MEKMTIQNRQPSATRQPVAAPPKPASRTRLWVLSASLAIVFIAVLAVAGKVMLGTSFGPAAPEPAPRPTEVSKHETPAVAPSPEHQPPPKPVAEVPTIVDDDGKTLWVSPTHGKPLDLAYLSPGAQIILALRPANLLKLADGAKIRAALGPLGQQAIETVEQVTTIPFNEIERLLIGCQISSAGEWSINFVVHAARPISRESLLAKLKDAIEKDHEGKKYFLSNGVAYYLPGGTVNNVLVAAPEDAIADVIDLAGQSPPLRRDIERLIAHTDADRQITIVFAPNSLFAEGQNLFRGEVSRLRDPLFWFLGDELSGAALSLNWDANFFLELTASPTLDTPPEKASRIFSRRVSEIPSRVDAYLATLNPQPYGKAMIARFPMMLRKFAKYTRAGLEDDRVMLRCYLPAAAGQNLLLAAELTLAEPPGDAASPVATSLAENNATTSIKDRLAKVTSLKFAKDTLESALDQLAQDIGAPIVIRGPDLQADGITKNQSFGIDLSNKPAEEILVEILHLANPDKTSPGTHDARQKLVYIAEQKPDKTEQIVVTTRAKAKERHNELPEAFRPTKP
jgi:hypothetical protein